MMKLNRRAMVSGLATMPLASTVGTAQVGTPVPIEAVEIPPVIVPDGALEMRIGFLPIMIYAPIYVALEKGYYARRGLNVTSVPLNSGTDLALMVSTNDLQVALSGVGPAFWNAVGTGLPLNIIAPGHEEGNPVSTPLMTGARSEITSVDQLKGKKVAVNAPGATEYWLDAALRTGGLTIGDVDLQYLTFPDAVAALVSGALAAAMIGEPLATQGVQDGSLRIVSNDFDVQGLQVTAVFSNNSWVDSHPAAAASFVAAYIEACRDLNEAPNDPLNLAIINKYTNVPLELIATSVRPVYQPNAEIDLENLMTLQEFFIDRGLMDEAVDPADVVRQDVIDAAVTEIGAE